MPSTAPRPLRKRRNQYHHGDLRRALLDEALRTIRQDGVEAVTLRKVGQSLGVSRTALYRHFSDKRALLAGVATEGFRMLRDRLPPLGVGGWGGVDSTRWRLVLRHRELVALPRHVRGLLTTRRATSWRANPQALSGWSIPHRCRRRLGARDNPQWLASSEPRCGIAMLDRWPSRQAPAVDDPRFALGARVYGDQGDLSLGPAEAEL
jgi:AcrR family transcriptional regulator